MKGLRSCRSSQYELGEARKSQGWVLVWTSLGSHFDDLFAYAHGSLRSMVLALACYQGLALVGVSRLTADA